MNDLLGTLIPLLLQGGSIGDILRMGGGQMSGASTMDGLTAAVNESLQNARLAYPMRPDSGRIQNAVETAVDRLGINPYTSLGQMVDRMITTAYQVAPGAVGGLLGIPNSAQLFQQVANGASGISQAAGFGMTDVLNPHSVMAAQERAVEMAKTVHGLGMRENGGYDISYAHGLNMEEMGTVAQRLLSSDVAYRDESGNRVDPGDADRFRDNLKRLGSKFNEAASMLAKVTGSVKDALAVMDRLAGGNFLGGSERQASEVANKAMRMAAAIRVTSAIAGVSPQEAFQNMQNLSLGAAAGMGVSPEIAAASGFQGMMMNMAFVGTNSYNTWLATHPNATQAEKDQARLATNGRVQMYAQSNGAALVAAVAANRHVFTDRQFATVREMIRTGRIDQASSIVMNAIGQDAFNEIMTNPAAHVAARRKAQVANPDVIEGLDEDAIASNLEQAERLGRRQWLVRTHADVSRDLFALTGKDVLGSTLEDAGKEALVKIAKKAGFGETYARKMNIVDLRKLLQESPNVDGDVLSKTEDAAVVDAMDAAVCKHTMLADEQANARRALVDHMVASGVVEKEGATKDELRKIAERMVDQSGTLEDAFRQFTFGMAPEKLSQFRKEVFNGKFSKERSDQELRRLDDLRKASDQKFSTEERMARLERQASQQGLYGGWATKAAAAGADGTPESDTKAKAVFYDAVVKSGISQDDIRAAEDASARRMVAGIFGGQLGDAKGERLKDIERRVSADIANRVRGGQDVKTAYTEALKELQKNGGLDASGVATLYKLIHDAPGDSRVTMREFLSGEASVFDEKTRGERDKALADMKRLVAADGNYGDMTGEQAFDRFIDSAKKAGGTSLTQDEIENLRADGKKTIRAGDPQSAKAAIDAAMAKLSPKGDRRNPATDFFAMSVAGDANRAAITMAAMAAKAQGVSIEGLKKLGVDKGTINLLTAIDDRKAETMNSVSDAVQVGGAEFRQNAVTAVEKQMGALSKALTEGGVTADTVRASQGIDKAAEEARKKIRLVLENAGRGDVDSDMAFIKATVKHKIGGRDAVDVLMEGTDGVRTARDNNKAKTDDQLVGIARDAAREESGIYAIVDAVGKIVEFINGLTNGDSGLKVTIANPQDVQGVFSIFGG